MQDPRDSIQSLRRLFEYDDRANREILSALEAAEPGAERALSVFAHVLAAEWLWLERLRRQRFKVVVWPDSSLSTCREQVEALPAAWQLFWDTLDPRSLSECINYTNTKGEPWSSTAEDILMHVVLHSSYHRGQIALLLRDASNEPPMTDFIHCVRQGWVS